jgi:hypothetical protein
MIRFLTWLRGIFLSVLNGLAKAVALVVLLVALLVVISLARGDGLPGNMVLALDLREPIDDSAAAPTSLLTPRRVTVMDVVLGLDAAGRDARVKGVVMRLGNGALSTRPRPRKSAPPLGASAPRASSSSPRPRLFQRRPGWTILPPAPPARSGCSPKVRSRPRARAAANCSCAAPSTRSMPSPDRQARRI